MLGFAIVDRKPTANATAVWLTCRIQGCQVNHTNAVVIPHDDERHDAKVRNLTADRAVVLTNGSTPPLPFADALSVDAFDDFRRCLDGKPLHGVAHRARSWPSG